MQELKDRIVKEGKVLPGNIIKVDGFLNHRIDTELPGPGRPYRRRRHRVLPGQLAGGCRRQAGGEIMPNAAPCPSTARRLPRFVRPMQIHRRKHLLFVGKNSCKIRQDSR